MWFDAKAKLAEIEERLPAKSANPAKQPTVAQAEFSSLASLADANRQDRGFSSSGGRVSGTHRRNPSLPHTPPICAHCGISDWTVSLTDIHGDKLHVACWQERQEHD